MSKENTQQAVTIDHFSLTLTCFKTTRHDVPISTEVLGVDVKVKREIDGVDFLTFLKSAFLDRYNSKNYKDPIDITAWVQECSLHVKTVEKVEITLLPNATFFVRIKAESVMMNKYVFEFRTNLVDAISSELSDYIRLLTTPPSQAVRYCPDY